jgi:hypothetical protein
MKRLIQTSQRILRIKGLLSPKKEYLMKTVNAHGTEFCVHHLKLFQL